MNGAVTVVFPHQLFAEHPALQRDKPVILVEEPLFFTQFRFHRQKLVFHRATMSFYRHHLEQQGYQVTYLDAAEPHADVRQLLPWLARQGVTDLHLADPVDDWLERRLHRTAKQYNITLTVYTSPLFLNSKEELDVWFKDKKRYFQTDFYIQQRKKRQILLDAAGQPLGGKWTFDTENRLKYPKGKTPPDIHFPEENEWVNAAKQHVSGQYPDHYGALPTAFRYPTTFEETAQWLDAFLHTRFYAFGEYEDALVRRAHILHHSVLTPMLNVGLITPQQILEKTVQYAHKNQIPLNSCEGFVRQILGWREFIRGVYQYRGRAERTRNFWQFKRKIPAGFWTGNTGIAPVDEVIQKVLKTGYCHHIERLMVLGNFMLLCEFDPDEVYRWFMEMFIDAYDWVMVPNVYGMSQFADGGMMSTKPYISGSNYLMKMSDYEKGAWQEIWDALFWRFMHVHREFFLQNPRLGMLVKTFDKMPVAKQTAHLSTAEQYLSQLDASTGA
jgi:deoxyribodipyrimidine photolyase-related protein